MSEQEALWLGRADQEESQWYDGLVERLLSATSRQDRQNYESETETWLDVIKRGED